MTAQKRMPVLFIGHGSPMNAIEENEFSAAWKRIASEIPKPSCILCVSAHWLTSGTAVIAMETPKTIHDFYGFPEKLYHMQYPAKGSKKYAEMVKETLDKTPVTLDTSWGLDHGTWSVLVHMYPNADIPVLQLSIDFGRPLATHVEIGKRLAALREKGVLIIGSGNVVHNLGMIDFSDTAKPFDWAVDFDAFVKESLAHNDSDALIHYTTQRTHKLAHPTNDHYIPMLYVVGAAEGERPTFYCERIVYGSLAMRCVKYG